MDESTRAQLALIHEVVRVVDAGGLCLWLFGGWGLDARLGLVSRAHGDVEFWVERRDGDAVRDALVESGATELTTQPPEESREFTTGEVQFSTAFFDREPDGTLTTQGRWSDWVFPIGSFDALPGHVDGVAVPAMSVEGMLAMKEQFPRLRNGRAWRDKDVRDIATLKSLAAIAGGGV